MNAAMINSSNVLSLQNDNSIWYDQGEALAKLGRYAEALASFEQVLAMQPNYHAAWVFKGVVLVQLRRYKEALASCEQALAINADDKQAWVIRGAALNYLGQYKKSYASYDKALGIERQSGWQKLYQMLKSICRIGNSYATTGTTSIG